MLILVWFVLVGVCGGLRVCMFLLDDLVVTVGLGGLLAFYVCGLFWITDD